MATCFAQRVEAQSVWLRQNAALHTISILGTYVVDCELRTIAKDGCRSATHLETTPVVAG